MKSRGQRLSRSQENRVAEDLGGRAQPASGATRFNKGDVRVMGEIHAECKVTERPSYRLSLSDIKKLKMESLLKGAEGWVFQIDFIQPQFSRTSLAVIDYQEYLQMREFWKEHH